MLIVLYALHTQNSNSYKSKNFSDVINILWYHSNPFLPLKENVNGIVVLLYYIERKIKNMYYSENFIPNAIKRII